MTRNSLMAELECGTFRIVIENTRDNQIPADWDDDTYRPVNVNVYGPDGQFWTALVRGDEFTQFAFRCEEQVYDR